MTKIQHEVETISVENAPRLFSEGSALNQSRNVAGLKTAADWNQIELRDALAGPTGLGLRISLKRCVQSNLPAGQSCAT